MTVTPAPPSSHADRAAMASLAAQAGDSTAGKPGLAGDPGDSLEIPEAQAATGPGRKALITRDDIVQAALKLVGPHRSVSSLSLREVAREAGIAPNSFYRQFRDMDELAVGLIELAGVSLRSIIGEARRRSSGGASVVRSAVQAFMDQLGSGDVLLHILLREGTVGSDAFKQAVDRQLSFFEEELRQDLIRLAAANGTGLYEPGLTAKAITRLVFAIGSTAMDLPQSQLPALTEQLVVMVRMIVTGTQTLAVVGSPDLTPLPNKG